MRIIINDKLLSSKRFNSLSKEQIILLLKISAKFGEENNTTITATKDYLAAVFMADNADIEELFNQGFFSLEDKQLSLYEEYINFFKNNSANVKACKERKVNPVEIKVEEKKVALATKEDRTDWELIKTKFNELCDGKQISKLQTLDPNRQKAARSIYKIAKSMKDPETGENYEFKSFEDFIDQYFEIIHTRQGFTKGWNYNDKPYKTSWDFFFTRQKFLNILEKNMYT